MAVRGIPTEVLVALDSFKGTFTAAQATAAVAAGLRAGGWPVTEMPIADGGEGTLAVLGGAWGLERRGISVRGPLGAPVEAAFGVGGRRAVVEMALASGLGLVPKAARDPLAADTHGTGELILAAVAAGASEVYVAVGGSATTDGGTGAVRAIEAGGGLGAARLTVLCDVRTAFVEAAAVFGPQKGASPAQVEHLTGRLDAQADAYRSSHGRDPRGVPMSGAAGGLAGGLWAAFGAALVPGAAFVLDALGFDAAMRAARGVITGEGRLDRGTLAGKAAGEVATRCRQAGVPCHAVAGHNALDRFDQRILDLQEILEATTLRELEEAGRALAGRI